MMIKCAQWFQTFTQLNNLKRFFSLFIQIKQRKYQTILTIYGRFQELYQFKALSIRVCFLAMGKKKFFLLMSSFVTLCAANRCLTRSCTAHRSCFHGVFSVQICMLGVSFCMVSAARALPWYPISTHLSLELLMTTNTSNDIAKMSHSQSLTDHFKCNWYYSLAIFDLLTKKSQFQLIYTNLLFALLFQSRDLCCLIPHQARLRCTTLQPVCEEKKKIADESLAQGCSVETFSLTRSLIPIH